MHIDKPLAEVSSVETVRSHAWTLENTVSKMTGEVWHPVSIIVIPRHQMQRH
uniref:Uncharacterized protein n=1 Tax=Physcomitrium patens TaxID=3218 RepID=A0A2K1L4C9_PHYPA|nr:hypothetical protein PHYPA_003677 [Physcomitrium patens]